MTHSAQSQRSENSIIVEPSITLQHFSNQCSLNGLEIEVLFPPRKKDGAHPTSYPVGIGDFLTGGTNGLEANAVMMLTL
jgi:hypothetical protein